MYPKYAQIEDKKYRINTDFRVAIKCNKIALDETIGDFERALAIIYLLFGEKGLKDSKNHEKLLKLGIKFLCCGKELENNSNQRADMDFEQDKELIKSSFKHDYGYNPYTKKYIHWWDFYSDLCNLSNSDMGDCCALNRVRNLRNYDTSKIKDPKERAKIEKAKKQVALKRKEIKITKEQEERMNEFLEQINYQERRR